MNFFPARRIELVAVEFAPQVFGPKGILADQEAGNIFQQVFGAALTNTGDTGISFNGHQYFTEVDPVRQAVGAGGVPQTNAGDARVAQGALSLLSEAGIQDRCGHETHSDGLA
ncbi:hypothetical protein N8600_02440 [Gammaproteobacteria bacterium]|nr:hypothetical protein [Gammaproteobacteria bacterium]